jgi:repressor LexA
MDELTERQVQVLVFINAYRARNQCNPTMQEIAYHFGFASANASHDHVGLLRKKGVLRTRGGKARGYIVDSPWDEVTA